jgi:hypothetical protein
MPYTSLYVRAAATAAPLITAGTNFTAEGFKFILEYLYTGAVSGVTTIASDSSSSSVDATKLRHTVQAARYFSMPKLKAAALQSAQAAGVTVKLPELSLMVTWQPLNQTITAVMIQSMSTRLLLVMTWIAMLLVCRRQQSVTAAVALAVYTACFVYYTCCMLV